MRIAINGFGRIGRIVLKIALDNRLNVVAINDPHGAESAAYLLKHDSVYGKYNRKVEVDNGDLIVDGKRIKVLMERDIEKLPWHDLKIDVVIESTGIFTEREKAIVHLKNGAYYVLITAPAENPDITVVPGVNHFKLSKNLRIISLASCTTNCLTPIAKVLNDKFGIRRALMTTVHAYTNDQAVHDDAHRKFRRGRAAGLNIIPTTTGAAEAITAVLPELEGRINGLAVRVPVACGSLVDLVAELNSFQEVKTINETFKNAAKKQMKGIIEYSEEELVSSDIIGNSHSAIFDSLCTQIDGNLVKILAWYDNEFGYSCRVVDVIKMIKKWC